MGGYTVTHTALRCDGVESGISFKKQETPCWEQSNTLRREIGRNSQEEIKQFCAQAPSTLCQESLGIWREEFGPEGAQTHTALTAAAPPPSHPPALMTVAPKPAWMILLKFLPACCSLHNSSSNMCNAPKEKKGSQHDELSVTRDALMQD
ncbi:hypothetical protein SRHO_G00173570 [Serrasalmus rhombeus]